MEHLAKHIEERLLDPRAVSDWQSRHLGLEQIKQQDHRRRAELRQAPLDGNAEAGQPLLHI